MIKKIIASTISKSISSYWYPNNGTPAWGPVRLGQGLHLMTDIDTTPNSATQMLNLNSVVAFLSGITNDIAYIGRVFIAFDLTSLAGLTLTSAKIVVQCISSGNSSWPNPQDYQAVLTPANFSNPIVTGDWNSVVDTPLCGEAPLPFATGEAVFTLNNAGITLLNSSIPSGLLKVAFRFTMDMVNSQPMSFTNIQFWFYNQNKVGSEPYLEINVPSCPNGNIQHKLISEGLI